MSQINFQDVIRRFEEQQAAANEANLQRFRQLTELLTNLGTQTQGTYADVLAQVQNVGDVARQRAQQDALRLQGRSEQDLIDRGLGNTTIRSSVQRGIASDAELNQQQIDEQQALLRSGVMERGAQSNIQTTGMLANMIEGRNDVAPDLGLYSQLLQAAAQNANRTPVTANVGATSPALGLAESLRSKFGTAGGGGGGSSGSPSGSFQPATGGGGGGGGSGVQWIGPGAGNPYDLGPGGNASGAYQPPTSTASSIKDSYLRRTGGPVTKSLSGAHIVAMGGIPYV